MRIQDLLKIAKEYGYRFYQDSTKRNWTWAIRRNMDSTYQHYFLGDRNTCSTTRPWSFRLYMMLHIQGVL